mgnify:CR=1 FL=1
MVDSAKLLRISKEPGEKNKKGRRLPSRGTDGPGVFSTAVSKDNLRILENTHNIHRPGRHIQNKNSSRGKPNYSSYFSRMKQLGSLQAAEILWVSFPRKRESSIRESKIAVSPLDAQSPAERGEAGSGISASLDSYFRRKDLPPCSIRLKCYGKLYITGVPH